MNNITKNLKILSITTLLICFTGVSQTANADIGLPDSPLFLGTAVPPNIFFSVDDSGSMNWEVLKSSGVSAITQYSGFPNSGGIDITPNHAHPW